MKLLVRKGKFPSTVVKSLKKGIYAKTPPLNQHEVDKLELEWKATEKLTRASEHAGYDDTVSQKSANFDEEHKSSSEFMRPSETSR